MTLDDGLRFVGHTVSESLSLVLRGTCPAAYVPQEQIERDFERVLRMIVIDEEVSGWVTTALRQSHADQKRFREAEIKKLNAEHERI